MVGPNYDTFADTVRKYHTDVFDLPLVTVHNFTGGYDPATGHADDWTRDSGTDIPAEVVVPSTPTTVVGPDGNESEVKARVYVRDDAPVTFYAVDAENQRPTEIVYDDSQYVVAERHDEQNGLLRLLCVEG